MQTLNSIIDYNDICKILKRYDFNEKMRICCKYSKLLLKSNGSIDRTVLSKYVFPWELETFLLLSIKATPEYNSLNFNGKNENKFFKMINGIRNFNPPKLMKHENTNFATYALSSMGLTQFDIQENLYYKLYRYSYIFNFKNNILDMEKEFYRKFNTNYNEFSKFGSLLIVLMGMDKQIDKKILEFIITKLFPIPFNNLSINLNEYNQQLDSITNDTNDYTTCLRPSFKYPFITKNNCAYLPLPHLIGRSITSSLLYRLTDDNSQLRTKIGKEVLESYLYKILKDSNMYDEIYTEKQFEKEHHNKAKTLDIMLREKNDYLLIDSKSSVPSMGLRTFNEKTYEKEILKLSENIVQIYKHLKIFMPKYKTYNPYCGHPTIDDEHLWGICVVLEDNYIMRLQIYEKAAEKLKLSNQSKEYQWMITHIKIASLFDIEKYSFVGDSLVKSLKEQIINGNPGDYSFIGYNLKTEIINQDCLSFKNFLYKDCKDCVKTMVDYDIINN